MNHQQYIVLIMRETNSYSVLADLVSQYTGGELDLNTEEAKLCWKVASPSGDDKYFFSSPLQLNNWMLPIINEMDKMDTNLIINKQIVNMKPDMFIQKAFVVQAHSIENLEELYFEIAFTSYAGTKRVDVEFYESIQKLLPEVTIDSLEQLISNNLPLVSTYTPMKLHNMQFLLTFNASNQQLYGHPSSGNEEKTTDYYEKLYFSVLVPFLLSITQNTKTKYVMNVLFKVANEDFESNSQTAWEFETIFSGSSNSVGIKDLFDPENMTLDLDPLSVILKTEKNFVL